MKSIFRVSWSQRKTFPFFLPFDRVSILNLFRMKLYNENCYFFERIHLTVRIFLIQFRFQYLYGYSVYVVEGFLKVVKRFKLEKWGKIYSRRAWWLLIFGIDSPKIIHEYINVLYDYYKLRLRRSFTCSKFISSASAVFIGFRERL